MQHCHLARGSQTFSSNLSVPPQDEARGTSAGMSGGCSGQAAYESVRSFCLQRPTVSYVDLMATFYDLSEEQLAKVLDGLVREGLIQVRRLGPRPAGCRVSWHVVEVCLQLIIMLCSLVVWFDCHEPLQGWFTTSLVAKSIESLVTRLRQAQRILCR